MDFINRGFEYRHMINANGDDFRQRQYDVLVSYSRADDDQRAELVKALEDVGYQVFWDGKLGPDYWRIEWRNRMEASKLMIVLWSIAAAASDEVKDEAGGAKAFQKCMSVPLDGEAHVPKPYRETNRHHWDRNADAGTRAAQLQKIIAKVAAIVGPPRRPPMAGSPPAIPVEWGEIPGAPPHLVGRESELAMLKNAWEGRAPKVNAVVLHALGGAGKSALLRTFANDLLAAGGGGAACIYGWSAYSQGSGEQKRADADSFISKALGDFGFEGELPKDPIERARALAKLIQKHRVLLLLDGLEPLQDPPGVNKGRFKDKGLAELVKMLANQNAGLVILTTRQEVPELEGRGAVVINHALEELSDRAGAELLVELGVRGRQRDLEAAVRSVDGHALSVTLLGTYLSEVCGGDVRHRDQFDFAKITLTEAEKEELATDKTIIPAKRAAKVMRGYLEQFEKLAKDNATTGLGGPERAILHLLGLFDRPADGKAVAALLEKRIPGLTDELFVDTITTTSGWWVFKSSKVEVRELSAGERTQRIRRAKERLRKLRLLSKPNPHDPLELDAHPIVRAYFAGRLEQTAPEAAKTAHDILYRHYSAAAPDLPDTLEEMQPLFHAVQHGVKSANVSDVFEEVYRRRISRGNEDYIVRVLGSIGTDLGVIANFFETPWRAVNPDLSTRAQDWLKGSVAFALVATGRIADSLEPRYATLEANIAHNDWESAARSGGALTDALRLIGRIRDAVLAAETAVRHADLSNDENQRVWLRANQAADSNLAAGRIDRAEELANSAATLLKNSSLPWQSFVGIPGYVLGDLMLSRGKHQDALHCAKYQLEMAELYLGRGLGLHDIGFAYLLMAQAQDGLGAKSEAQQSYDASVLGMRRAGTLQHLPRSLLARAEHHRRRRAAGEKCLIDQIQADLAEVEDIAGSEMKLYLTDLSLERARLALDVPAAFPTPQAALSEAREQTARAEALIEETGYHRRDGELAELQQRLAVA